MYHIVNVKVYKMTRMVLRQEDGITGAEPCNASVNEQQQYPQQTGVLHVPTEEKMRKLSEGWKLKENKSQKMK
ncbi:hypothetical protein E2C01_081260 [Portunus trituberculatus]|uniref:Uncharacterized protein n=1 Tax=Portunus trituberculatus TaxID=210409 RepID=A0A5B7IRG9_PORTR|nr:hypothetical protein [Portunus trituberculatus]